MLLSLLFLILSFGFIKVEDLNGSSRDSDPGYDIGKNPEEGNSYNKYRLDKSNHGKNYIAISMSTKLKFRSIPTNPKKIWSKGIVPFIISKNCSRKQRKVILEGIKRLKIETCVRFIPWKNETTFITISPGKRCQTAFGNRKDLKLTADKGCYEQDGILFELMNVLDFTLQKNKLGEKKNFKISKTGVHLDKRNDTIRNDFMKINNIYGCNEKESNGSKNRINGRFLQISSRINGPYRSKRSLLISKIDGSFKVSETESIIENDVTSPIDSEAPDPTHKCASSINTEATVGNVVPSNQESNEGGIDLQDSHIPLVSDHYHIINITGPDLRTIVSHPSKLWSDGRIPYVLSDKYDAEEKSLLREGIETFHNKTCVQLIPRTTEATYFFIQPGNKCSATIGKIEGGINNVTIGSGCFLPGTILHEIMHVMGFIHEQSRPDRDSYVMIVWDNIMPVAKSNFRKFAQHEVMDFGAGYDYESVMHYGQYAFAIDGDRPTIIPLQPGVMIGQRLGFSKKDIFKINKLFKCGEQTGFEPNGVESHTKKFGKKFLDYVAKLFKAIFRAMLRFQANTSDRSH